MNKNYYIIVLIVTAVVILGGIFYTSNFSPKTNTADNSPAVNNDNNNQDTIVQTQEELKEFKMDSFYEMIDDKAKPQFSLNEITVKKGDNVRITVTVTKGSHDFAIDEYNIKTETPLNQPTMIEFTADKTGEFIYYCSKPGHREAGQWGTLRVVE